MDPQSGAGGERHPLDTVLEHALRRLVDDRRGRAVAYAEYDTERRMLVRRWSILAPYGFETDEIEVDPSRVHPLLLDDAGADRPVRPGSSIPDWVVRDLLGGPVEDDGIFVRAIADDGRMFGALLIAEPRRLLGNTTADDLEAGAGLVELAVSRHFLRQRIEAMAAEHQAALDALGQRSAQRIEELEREVEDARSAVEEADTSDHREQALELAQERATELLADTHIELARRTDRLRRQTRVLYRIRKMLSRHAAGAAPRELAQDLVQCAAEAFGGGRCSLMLVDPARAGGDDLRLAAALGLPAAVDPLKIRVPRGAGISGWVAANLTPVVVRDDEEAEGLRLIADSDYTGSAFVSLPLVFQGRFQGVLNLTNFREGTFDDAELEQLRLVALCIALVADHARLSERLFAVEARTANE